MTAKNTAFLAELSNGDVFFFGFSLLRQHFLERLFGANHIHGWIPTDMGVGERFGYRLLCV